MTMTLVEILITYVACLVVFLAVDFVWLGWIAKPFYHRQLDALLRKRVKWPAAIAFYLIYIIGLMIFCVYPAIGQGAFITAAMLGGLYGFFTYTTYELTHYALIRKWPAALVPMDIGWGVVLCAIVASCGYHVARWLQM